ncbi:MAG: hypothetical protein AB7S26_41795 [Sandaracinaceae bacterium]
MRCATDQVDETRERRTRLALSALLVLAVLSPVGARAQIADEVVATVDGKRIWVSDLREQAQHQDVGPSHYPALLTEMIDLCLLVREGIRLGLTVSEEDLDRAVEHLLRQTGDTEEALAAEVSERGWTMVSYREDIRAHLLRLRVVEHFQARTGQTVDPEAALLATLRRNARITRRF